MTSLEVTLRNDSGKGVARKLRAVGKIPAIIYGPGSEPIPVSASPDALVDMFNRSGNRNMLVDLQVGGDSIACLVREVQRHPVSRDIVHVDFYRVGADRTVVVDVAVNTVGTPVGAKLGGRLRLIRRSLQATCLPKDIPASFDLDVTAMEVGDFVTAFEVPLPSGVALVSDVDFNVVSCYGKSAEKEEAEAEGEGEGEGEGDAGQAEADQAEAE
jgi:large subunit ribosomal protein L25